MVTIEIVLGVKQASHFRIMPDFRPRGVFRTGRTLPHFRRKRLASTLRTSNDGGFEVIVLAVTFRTNMFGPTVRWNHVFEVLNCA